MHDKAYCSEHGQPWLLTRMHLKDNVVGNSNSAAHHLEPSTQTDLPHIPSCYLCLAWYFSAGAVPELQSVLFLPYSMGAASTGVTRPRTITSRPPSLSLSRLKPSCFLPELLFISYQAAVITSDKRQTFINKQRPTFICRTSSDPAEVLLLSHC